MIFITLALYFRRAIPKISTSTKEYKHKHKLILKFNTIWEIYRSNKNKLGRNQGSNLLYLWDPKHFHKKTWDISETKQCNMND